MGSSPARGEPVEPRITIVGITDAGAESLTEQARALVDGAALLCGGERHLGFFPEHPARRFVIKSNVEALVAELGQATEHTVVLASGDPNLYGIGSLLATRLGLDRVRILPNVSAVQIAFARLGLSWQDTAILSAHGRPLDAILAPALYAQSAAILTDDRNTPAVIARALLDAGDEDATANVFEHLGSPDERHTRGCLSSVAAQSFAPLNLMVVSHGKSRSWPLGLPDEAYAHRAGLITKSEVRAVSLSKLQLHELATVWDVGAGCGSVSIEAAGLARLGRVYAVERDAEQLRYLAENRQLFGAGNVCIVEGEAPTALTSLPAPDAVFIGGSGGQLTSIARVAMERLHPAGRLVANIVALEHIGALVEIGRTTGWEQEITHLAVARSADTAGLTRLAALNPVYVITFHRAGQ